jgi:regulator of replication initiation timing
MATKKVVSPAGESIEIVPDEEWISLVGGNGPGALKQFHGTKPALLAQLWLHGTVHNNSGTATADLYERIVTAYPDQRFGAQSSITTLMGDDVNTPAFQRKTKGKRTYSIRLQAMPESWYNKLIRSGLVSANGTNGKEANGTNGTNGHSNGIKIEPLGERKVTIRPWPTSTFTEKAIESFQPEPLPAEEVEPASIDVEISRSVAMSLLTTVVEIISAGTPEQANEANRQLRSELETVSGRLAQRLEENERLRRQLREVGDELQSMRYERDGLRQRLRNTESNLTAALKGDQQRLINNEVQKRIDQFMRAAPKGANAHHESES